MLSRKVFPGISFSIDCRKMSIFTLERVAQSTLGSAQRAAMQTTKPVRVEMIIVSIKTENTWMNPCSTGWSLSATAAAMVAVPMPASLDSRPRLIPWISAMPNMPPKIASGLKAPPITLAKKAGIEVTLHTTRIMTSTR